MLALLRAVAEHQNAQPMLDPILASTGTKLIIAQQNVARRVTAEEYREVLLAFVARRPPQLAAVPLGEARARKGREGLLQDVLPSLQWGAAHVDLLASRLDAAARLDIAAEARQLALSNLPRTEVLDVPLYLVMGGRAGAAAGAKGIYFDVLAMSSRGDHYPASQEIVEFFAHEMHHVGLARILDERQARLQLDADGRRAFDFLRGLVMEGSASYLINGHRDLAGMRRDPMFAGDDQSRMRSVAQAFNGVLNEHWPPATYDEAMTQFAGNELHITGATMLDAIYRAEGRQAVMRVMEDPRQLVLRYNQSTAKDPQAFHFPASLASQVAHLGDVIPE